MTDLEFRALLDWYMCSDPWPLDGENHKAITALVQRESLNRGYDDWTEAMHNFLKEQKP